MKNKTNLTTLEKRIEQIEKDLKDNSPFRSHLILVEPGSTFEETLEEYKKDHTVLDSDQFTIIEFVDPKDRKTNDTK